MDTPLDEQYLTWLQAQVRVPRARYWKLLRQLYVTEFVWFVPNDDNRVADGKDLRHEFLEEKHILEIDPDWLTLGCSMLEMLIGLARLWSFEEDLSVGFCFWRMIDNLGLSQCNDRQPNPQYVSEVLDRVIWRTYEPDGTGGLFPLTDPHYDQREVELWYQLCAYILERD